MFARHTHTLYFSGYMRDRGKKGGGCCSFFGFAVFPLLLCACCIWLCCPDKPHKNSGKRRRRLATTTTPVCTVQYTVYVWRTQPIGSSLRGHRATLSYDLIWPPPPPPRKTSFGDLALQPSKAPHPTTTILQPKGKLGGGGGGGVGFPN